MASTIRENVPADNLPCRLLELPAELRLTIYDFLLEGNETTSFRHGRWAVDIQPVSDAVIFPDDALSLYNSRSQIRTELTPLHDRWVHALDLTFTIARATQDNAPMRFAVLLHLAKCTKKLRIRVDLWTADRRVAQQLLRLLQGLGPSHMVDSLDLRIEGWSINHMCQTREAINQSFDCLERMQCKLRHERPWRSIWTSIQAGPGAWCKMPREEHILRLGFASEL